MWLIYIITAEGRFLRMFGGYGDGPTGVVIDTSDLVYVCDGGNTRVSVFTSEGVFLTSFGSRGTNLDSLCVLVEYMLIIVE